MRSLGKIKKNKIDKTGKRQGYWEYYWLNSNLMSKGSFNNGKREGEWEYYYECGILSSKGSFNNDRFEGIWELYDDEGDLIDIKLYENGVLIKEL